MMNRANFLLAPVALAGLFATPLTAQETTLIGPGTVSIETESGITMTFGGQLRQVPTFEDNWDFGISDDNDIDIFTTHVNEAGTVNSAYIRSEDRLYFNALPEDESWSFYTALEFDRPLEVDTTDNRGGLGEDSNFGIERLKGSLALPYNHRLNIGWDVWELDIGPAAGIVYADDSPAAWIDGGSGPFEYSVAYIKAQEANFESSSSDLVDTTGDDRTIYAGYLDYHLNDANQVRTFYAFDSIGLKSNATINDAILGGADSGLSGGFTDTESHHIGAYYTGEIGPVSYMAEGAYQFGNAEITDGAPFPQDDFDINAYALAGVIGIELGDPDGFSIKPRIGGIYHTGDDNPGDDDLEGYTAASSFMRFTDSWGGEHTIMADTNFVLGTPLYSFLPEGLGNGTPVVTGGLENLAGAGFGRGDNPGLGMLTLGLTAQPLPTVTYETNANALWWNEDQLVTSFGDGTRTIVESGYFGIEWDNQVTYLYNDNVALLGQFSFFFPGDGVEDLTSALTAAAGAPGPVSDSITSRIAAELIWTF